MTLKDELMELAEKVEKATGPDRELDAKIAAVAHMKQLTYQSPEWIKDPEFTASLDAAMTLVPEGGPFILTNADLDTLGDYTSWRVSLEEGGALPIPCATPALAVCAAALRARASIKGSSHVGQ